MKATTIVDTLIAMAPTAGESDDATIFVLDAPCGAASDFGVQARGSGYRPPHAGQASPGTWRERV